ncbi:A/G-specific adenine glycosylase [Rhodoferax fermentans]|uniref:Adenine DNA glycosylase n=1 Tax=Rhodoferax fermentans TaxID=28066 RepID=A0A1T1AWY4_RHOFE|nr:A/G-specific adenine glycosylase [Rhodoferax fermentans]MBK1682585.1 A/G-specific adenine glycosylase [Rhodoferax fermentans]OOV08567.1 A/G-specific adenine glycosylase [Rhodoferax fermentans]
MPLELIAQNFAQRLVDWQRAHGRHDLPWQATREPYHVWLSEIMLQQTQVVTVRDYFTRFVARFPNVAALAKAPLDDVLGLWSGLGYYSRARNMHLCAQQVMAVHGGAFPRTAALLQTLPGIGPSTAAAVASICFGERVAILDGNVKRVLTRFLGFEADLALSANERQLWQEANRLLPEHDLAHTMPRYTQAIMDLGATVCTARKPACVACPFHGDCRAEALARQESFPVKTRKLKRTAQTIWLLWAVSDDAAVWLSQRPTPGVWAGLYCLPLFENREALLASVPPARHSQLQDQPVIKHVLTHKDLYLHPVSVVLPTGSPPDVAGAWVEAERWPSLGLPAPIRKLLTC